MSEIPVASAHSDVGLVRAVNEDSVLARYPFFLVADGMGGHERGDRASSTALNTIDAAIPGDEPVSPAEVVAAVHAANTAIRKLGAEDGTISGTTLTGVAAVRTAEGALHWMVVNVGDSRVYAWNGRHLTQLTVDHSVVQELVDAGVISPEEALRHPDRNTITRALGAFDDVEIDAWLLPYDDGTTYLVCSDGVTKELDHDRLAALLAAGEPASGSRAAAIVDAAVAAGGHDNASAIVVEAAASAVVTESTGVLTEHAEFDDTRPRSIR